MLKQLVSEWECLAPNCPSCCHTVSVSVCGRGKQIGSVHDTNRASTSTSLHEYCGKLEWLEKVFIFSVRSSKGIFRLVRSTDECSNWRKGLCNLPPPRPASALASVPGPASHFRSWLWLSAATASDLRTLWPWGEHGSWSTGTKHKILR